MQYLILKRPHHNQLSLQIESLDLMLLLEQVYYPYVFYEKATAHPDIVIANNVIHFLNSSQQYCTSHLNLDNQLLQIEKIIEMQTSINDQIVAFHGAAINYNNECILLLSPTHGGKSTLASFLIATNHCQLVADDCILVEKKSLLVFPYTVPVKLRNESLSVLSQYDFFLHYSGNRIKDLKTCHLFFPETVPPTELKIGRIFWTYYNNKASNSFVKMTTCESILSLLSSTLFEYPLTKDYLGFLKMISGANCFFVEYSDLNFAKESIMGQPFNKRRNIR